MKRIILGEPDSKNPDDLHFATDAAILDYLDSSDDDIVIVDARLVDSVDWPYLESSRHDVVHSGLAFISTQYFEILNYCVSSWFFLNSPEHKACVSWKATAHLIYLKRNRVKQVGGTDRKYDSIHTALSDLTYRILKYGGSVEYDPRLLKSNSYKLTGEEIKSSTRDQFRFIGKFIGRNALVYAKFFTLFGNLFRPSVWRNVFLPQAKIDQVTPKTRYDFNLVFSERQKRVDVYSAIIPTINRYDYIGRSIDSLLNDKIPPAEVIVVDQTPVNLRKMEVYGKYHADPRVKVFFLDSPGQSSSRNFAIEKASNEWLLLFEDDAEAWDDMIENHIKLLEYSDADVSTGVSLAPWKDVSFIPESNRKFFLADVLATGNAFVRRSDILKVGGLDLAFNKGSGADDDIGKRLHLDGKKVIFNYRAIETHHKASTGGMRTHGSWWNNKTTILGEFPPATKVYSIQKFYPQKFRLALYLQFFLAAKRRHSRMEFFFLWILAPYKLAKAMSKAKGLARISNIPQS